ncbi:MAG: DUF2804 domain-containing protein [Myxococcales bacterium]
MTEPIDLCDAAGRLNPAAAGWARRPLVRANLAGHPLRKKRWEYWCITDERSLLAAVIADLDYLAFAGVSVIDLATGERRDRVKVAPGGIEMPQTVRGGLVELGGVRLEPGRLLVSMGPIGAEIALAPPAGDSLQVVVPWTPDRFQLTCEQIGVRASGWIRCGERTTVLGTCAWAALDCGRGVWPVRASWNWAAAAGGDLAFNLGARWSDTENAFFERGAIRHFDERVRFGDRRIDGPSVALEFTPILTRNLGWPGVAGLRWSAGRFSGRIGGREIARLFGWSERFDVLW